MSIEAMKQMVHEMEYVLSCINANKMPFDGDDFHEALRLGRQAIAEAENNYQGSDAAKAAHMMDLYVALGVKWGEDPFSVIGKMRDTFSEAKKQEPVGEVEQIDYDDEGTASAWFTLHDDVEIGDKLYTSPPQRQWVGLTQEDLDHYREQRWWSAVDMAKEVEAILKEKNNG